mmetsp:Transcript_18838/g.23167  ORF Transcript_18838/g.23167 Transcript_18838/m.23167 type:complete len:267 (-) Transcript_18838:132-932(-)
MSLYCYKPFAVGNGFRQQLNSPTPSSGSGCSLSTISSNTSFSDCNSNSNKNISYDNNCNNIKCNNNNSSKYNVNMEYDIILAIQAYLNDETIIEYISRDEWAKCNINININTCINKNINNDDSINNINLDDNTQQKRFKWNEVVKARFDDGKYYYGTVWKQPDKQNGQYIVKWMFHKNSSSIYAVNMYKYNDHSIICSADVNKIRKAFQTGTEIIFSYQYDILVDLGMINPNIIPKPNIKYDSKGKPKIYRWDGLKSKWIVSKKKK